MGFILRDFECDTCRTVFEALVLPNAQLASHTCGGQGSRIFSFKGLIKIQQESDLPPLLAKDSGLLREVSPGKKLDRPWEEERDYSGVRWVEKKLPDGRTVRRPSMKIDEPKSRGLNTNLELDIKRDAIKRRK